MANERVQTNAAGQVVRPFDLEVDAERYWLTRSLGPEAPAAFGVVRTWLLAGCAGDGGG